MLVFGGVLFRASDSVGRRIIEAMVPEAGDETTLGDFRATIDSFLDDATLPDGLAMNFADFLDEEPSLDPT